MATIHLQQTTTATPEQFVAALTDFGPGRSEIFSRSTDGYLKVQLGEIAQRVRDGRLRTNIGQVATLDEAVAAFNPTERINGKTIIRIR